MLQIMELISILVYLMFITSSVFCDDRLELSAYEYLRRFDNKPLTLGQCPNRIISYPDHPAYKEVCKLPNRNGDTAYKNKAVDSHINTNIRDASELLQHIKMCDERSAAYFGLLAKGDCIGSEIAEKLSFTPKHATRMFLEHFRPHIHFLQPGELAIPHSYLLYYNNTYYTENIGIGTEEVLIVQMQFSKDHLATKANNLHMDSKRLSENVIQIAKHVGLPRKIKVVRLSTSDMDFQIRVFKDQDIRHSISYVEQCEKNITQVRQDLLLGRRSTPLKYGFKAFEIGPMTVPLSSVTGEEKNKNWEVVALLQVDASREYTTNKRFRKLCRSFKHDYKLNRQEQKSCTLTKQTLNQLMRLITSIHMQRHDWLTISYDQQIQFIEKGKTNLKLLKTRMKDLTKELRKTIPMKQTPSAKF